MEQRPIRELKKGELFRLSDSETAPVWVRGEYIRQPKKNIKHKCDEVNHDRLLSGDKRDNLDFKF